MTKYESSANREEAKNERKLAQKITKRGFIWSGENLDELTPQNALAVIVRIASEQGGIHELGNLERTMVQIARATASDASVDDLKMHQGIVGKPLPEDVLAAIEQLASNTSSLTQDLEQAYLENLELLYTEDIRACEQDSTCINDILETNTNRAVSTGISGEKINDFRRRIETWAYVQEEVA